MRDIVYPDYGRSILNLVASVAGHYGLDTGYGGLDAADRALEAGPRNIVLSVFDGMGAMALERNLPPDSFTRRNSAATISSVFPSTTTAAMTSFYSGLSPNEHGWLGWSLFLKEYGRTMDTFLDRDSFTKRPLGPRGIAASLMPYEDIFERIQELRGSSLSVYTVNPSAIQKNPDERHLAVGSLDGLFETLRGLCAAPGEKLIFSYWPEPDSTMHSNGPYSPEAVALFEEIDTGLADLAASARDSVFLATADHGQTDIEREIDLTAMPELASCLAMPPFVESRALSLFILPGMEGKFRRAFKALLGGEFLLLPRRKVFSTGLLGPGKSHPKVEDFIGDFLAIATGTSRLIWKTPFPANGEEMIFKGHHAGLRREEMLVPLVVAVT